MPTVNTSLGTLSYTDEGQGPPVLLLHAALHDRTDYDGVRSSLTPRHRVLAVDWPGHGESPSPETPLTAVQFGDLAVEFVDRLDLTNLVVIGNSVGGYAAARLAIERHERLAGVVLVNTGGFTDHNAATRKFCAVMGGPRIVRLAFPVFVRAYMHARTAGDQAIVRRVVARGRTLDGARTAAALWRSFTEPGHDLRQAAATIAVPVLITWGTKDVSAPRRWGERVASAIPGSRFETFPTGHVVFASEPDAWLATVQPFVESAQSRVTE
jgi:pimeloyl-ACP methyl ester carboxylesterase